MRTAGRPDDAPRLLGLLLGLLDRLPRSSGPFAANGFSKGTGAPNAIPVRHAQLNQPNGTPARSPRHFHRGRPEAASGGRKVEARAPILMLF